MTDLNMKDSITVYPETKEPVVQYNSGADEIVIHNIPDKKNIKLDAKWPLHLSVSINSRVTETVM